MLDAILCALIKFVNLIIDNLIDIIIVALGWVISLLPSLPIKFEPIQWGAFGSSVGYFIPVQTMVTHFTMMLALIAVWYSVEHIMRLIKMIK